jgi:hypothetical protein
MSLTISILLSSVGLPLFLSFIENEPEFLLRWDKLIVNQTCGVAYQTSDSSIGIHRTAFFFLSDASVASDRILLKDLIEAERSDVYRQEKIPPEIYYTSKPSVFNSALSESVRPLDLVVTWGVGWPFLSHRCTAIYRDLSGSGRIIVASSGMLFSRKIPVVFPPGTRPPVWLPTDIKYSGLLCNIIFLWIMVWFAYSSFVTIRSFIRKRRLQCVRCGYSMQGISSSKCPECGSCWKQNLS